MFFFSSRRRHTRYWRDWSSDVCSSDLGVAEKGQTGHGQLLGGECRPASVCRLLGTISGVPNGRLKYSRRRHGRARTPAGGPADRESGREGKGGTLGGRRNI